MIEIFYMYIIYGTCIYTVCACYIIIRVTARQPVRDASFQVAIKRVLHCTYIVLGGGGGWLALSMRQTWWTELIAHRR